MGRRGLREALFRGLSLVELELLARGKVMTITWVVNFDELSLLQSVRLVLVAKLTRCAVIVVLFHNDRQGCLYLFETSFLLTSRSILFFFFNKTNEALLPFF
jgi:hypothetical protein